MMHILKASYIVFTLFLSCSANALTFKSDGTVVQKSGKIVKESFATRFGQQFFPGAENWPKARGTGQEPEGYLGENLLMPGTPLMVIQNIKKGDSYADALMKQNGFSDKASLQRFIVANANPKFMETLGLSESDAATYVGNVNPELLGGLSGDYQTQLASAIKAVEAEVSKNVENAVEDSVNEAVESAVEGSVSDAVESAVDEAVGNAVDEAVSSAIDQAMDDWWSGYIQDLIDSGATILEQSDYSVTYTYD